MRCMSLCILEAVEVVPEVPEVMRCVLRCILEVLDGKLCLLEVLQAPEGMRCVLLCMLEVVEGTLWLWSRWRCRGCWR